MTIVPFDWVASLLGGALIGSAAVALMALNGRIAGISGIVGGLSSAASSDRVWRILFFCGLVVGVAAAATLGVIAPPSAAPASLFAVVIAAILVGVGTGLASGCTSGHGVCGLSRGSPRSLVATLTFMVCGAIAVYVVRHVLQK